MLIFMLNKQRIRLTLPLCAVLLAVSVFPLYADPIKKLPDEPEEPASAAGEISDKPEENSEAEAVEKDKEAQAEEKAKPKTAQYSCVMQIGVILFQFYCRKYFR